MPEILASQRRSPIVARMRKRWTTRMAGCSPGVEQVRGWLAPQPNFDVLYVHYSDVLADPESEARRVNDFLGNRLHYEAMAEVVDPDLYRNRRPAGDAPKS